VGITSPKSARHCYDPKASQRQVLRRFLGRNSLATGDQDTIGFLQRATGYSYGVVGGVYEALPFSFLMAAAGKRQESTFPEHHPRYIDRRRSLAATKAGHSWPMTGVGRRTM